jgi:Dolichyl-phosphate-mannose-protein mannosyltransferase
MVKTEDHSKGRDPGRVSLLPRLATFTGWRATSSSGQGITGDGLSTTESNSRPLVVSPRHFFIAAALLLLVSATALRFFHLGKRSLWYDEAVTANASRGTFAQVLEKTRGYSAPVIHPYLLYLAEKVDRGPEAVRMPSVLASLLAVVMMLAMVRVKVSPNSALFSAAILAFSSSQIRYAQEVREYALAVLVATVLIFALLRWEASGSRHDHPALLYAALFIAPLVQYGLVLFAFAILSTIFLRLLVTRNTSFSLSRGLTASSFLVAGGLLSLFLTLRTQYHPGGTQWYLTKNYFDPSTMGPLHFLSTNSIGLVMFLIPGHMVDLCFAAATIIFCILQAMGRKSVTVTLLLLTSLSITIAVSLARVYPYGGIRQCLFLAPVLALFAGVVLADLPDRIKGPLQPLATVVVMGVIVLSLFRDTLHSWPYRELEDSQSILKQLEKSMAPNDQVWVNHDAVAAFQFYLPKKDPRFTYGKFHANPNEYYPELLRSINPEDSRLWLVFSHLEQQSDYAEEQLIVNSMRSGWNVRSVIEPVNTGLYVAYRKTAP